MKQNLVSIFFCLLIGLSLSYFMFNQYEKIEPSIKESEILEFLQIGVYSSKESMMENMKNITSYIYNEQDGKFFVYVGITTKENLDKVKGYFNKKGYDIYVKEINVENTAFLQILDQYEIMIKEIQDISLIDSIENQVLDKYEELVINAENI